MASFLYVALLAVFGLGSAQQICDQFGQARTEWYIVMNNRWGSSAPQCIQVQGNGFKIVQQDGATSGGAPLSYPAVYYGCHYTNCSPGTKLPKRVREMNSITSTISYTWADGVYDAAYDIWLDPNPNISGVNAQEIMIWLNKVGNIQPVGGPVGNVNIAGINWQVWIGNNGGNNVISYVGPNAIPYLQFSIMDFLNDCISRGLFDNNWYLTSVQAGFEPWSGGVGLAVNDLNVTIDP